MLEPDIKLYSPLSKRGRSLSIWVLLVALVPVAMNPRPSQAEDKQREPSAGVALIDRQRDVQSLDVYADGNTIHLLTGEAHSGSTALYYRRSVDRGTTWSKPVRVDAGSAPPHHPHRGADPQVVAAGNTLIAAWTMRGTGYADSGPLATARSADGGLSWQPGPNPADDGATTGHGYIDIAANQNGLHMVWLDSRLPPEPPGVRGLFSRWKKPKETQGLRYARSIDGGAHWSANVTLDAVTCECCWNTLQSGPGGKLYTLYRGAQPRDMLLATTNGAKAWQARGPVGKFDWKVDACPHSGGGLAADKTGLHAVVWSGHEDALGVWYLVSGDGGVAWSKPRRLGDNTAKHPDIAGSGDGTLAAVWNGRGGTDKKAAVFGALSKDGGRRWSAPRRLSAAGARASHPRVINSQGKLTAFWTEGDSKKGYVLMMQAL